MIISGSQLLLGKNNKNPELFTKRSIFPTFKIAKKHFENVNNATQQQYLPEARSTLQNVLDSQPDEIASSVTALSAGRISKLEQDPHG